jgi:hypothetical protein
MHLFGDTVENHEHHSEFFVSWWIFEPVTSRIQFRIVTILVMSQGSGVVTATGYSMDGRGIGVRVPVEARFVASSRRPDRFWGPPNVVSHGYRGSFSGGKAVGE